MKNVVITGSSGLIGSACVEKFLEEGWNVIGIDNFTREKLFGDKADTHCNLDHLKKEKYYTFVESDIRSNKGSNIGNPNKLSFMELAEIIKQITGSEPIFRYFPLPHDYLHRLYQIIEKAYKVLNGSAKVNLKIGLKKTIHYMTSEMC